MMELRRIGTESPLYAQVEGLMNEAFPADERRDDEAQRYNADNDEDFHCCAVVRGEEFVGLVNFWTFGRFAYIEHFATRAELRGQGIGKEALAAVQRRYSPIVLEVEMPDNETAKRRVDFYTRNGFRMWNARYIQPPYSPEKNSLEMKLLVSGSLSEEADLEEVVRTIYSRVYGVK